MRRRVIALAFFSFLVLGTWGMELGAELSSINYKVTESFFSGGGGNDISSSVYKLDEGSIDSASKEAMTSTNYGVAGLIGASHGIQVPVIQSVTPGPLSKFFTDELPSYTMTAQNPGTGNLDYQIKEGSTVKAAWQTSNNLSYSVSGPDKGRHDLSFMIRNQEGTTLAAKGQYLFRRPNK